MSKPPSRAKRVREILHRAGPDGVDVTQLAAELGEDRKHVEYSVVDLTKRNEAIRVAPGRYRMLDETERLQAARRRAESFRRAEREESGEPAGRRTGTSTAAPVEIGRLVVIGRRRDGSLVCEDGTGDLWVATKVAEGRKR